MLTAHERPTRSRYVMSERYGSTVDHVVMLLVEQSSTTNWHGRTGTRARSPPWQTSGLLHADCAINIGAPRRHLDGASSGDLCADRQGNVKIT